MMMEFDDAELLGEKLESVPLSIEPSQTDSALSSSPGTPGTPMTDSPLTVPPPPVPFDELPTAKRPKKKAKNICVRFTCEELKAGKAVWCSRDRRLFENSRADAHSQGHGEAFDSLDRSSQELSNKMEKYDMVTIFY